MHRLWGFLSMVILLLATGCAAPMSQIVTTRQGETIDQQLFKEGEKVKVTYKDEQAKMRTKKGRVLHVDDDSVTLDGGIKGPIDLDYRRIHTFSRPIRVDRWSGSLSAGTFPGLVFLSPGHRFTGIGLASRYMPYSNRAFEVVLIGGQKEGVFPLWLSMTLNAHVYTIMPRTYLLFGVGGIVWSEPRCDREWEASCPSILRLGLGVESPISKRFNVRVEADLFGGINIHFERSIR